MSETTADTLLAQLREDAPLFGPALARRAAERGLAVTRPDGSRLPIPVTATPVVLPGPELARRQRLAALIAQAGTRMARAVLGSPAHRDLILAGLSPLEREVALATFPSVTTLVTTRVDCFVNTQVKALELNGTIPAMQAYSDIAAQTFLEEVGRAWDVPASTVQDLQRKNGSNALALLDALKAGYRQVRPGRDPERLLLLCRRNDAQLTEQQALARAFTEAGVEAAVAHPDELSGDDAVLAHGKAWDLVYRHLFVRRLEDPDLKGAAYVKALFLEPQGRRAVLLNPPASQVEVKAIFALLSAALEDPSLAALGGLTDEELAVISQAIPWTRRLVGGELLEKVKANPDHHVLKRSWDYGGRAVFVGMTRHERSFADRVKLAYGAPLEWEALCERAAADTAGGGFVVQEVVKTAPERHLVVSVDGAQELDLFVDFSTYASVGLPHQPAWGGVCRGSVSHIVNIVGGGGVLPLLTEEVALGLLRARRRSL